MISNGKLLGFQTGKKKFTIAPAAAAAAAAATTCVCERESCDKRWIDTRLLRLNAAAPRHTRRTRGREESEPREEVLFKK